MPTERAWRRAAALEAAAIAFTGIGADCHDMREAGRRITHLADQFETDRKSTRLNSSH